MFASHNADPMRTANVRLCRLRVWPNYTGLGFYLEQSQSPPFIIRIVESNSPAAACGLRISDIILAVNNEGVSVSASFNDIGRAVKAARETNQPIELLVVERRFYETLKSKVESFDPTLAKLMETPASMPRSYSNFPPHTPRTCEIRLNKTDASFGFEIANGEKNVGLYIQEVAVNSPASQTSLRKSDRILEVDDKFIDIEASKSIIEKLGKAKTKRAVKLYVVDTATYKYFQENKIPLQSNDFRRSKFAKQLLRRPQNESDDTTSENSDQDDPRPSSSKTSTLRPNMIRVKTDDNISDRQPPEDIRLCTIQRTGSTDPYGVELNYHKRDQFHSLKIIVGRNNELSNAERAGVKSDDRLIEINGQNVENLGNDEVKQCIRAIKYPERLQLLVADTATYEYYKQNNKIIHRGLPSVRNIGDVKPSRSLSPTSSSHISSEQTSDNDNGYINDLDVSYHVNYDRDDNDDNVSQISVQTSSVTKNSSSLINVCKGDLIAQRIDVIVVCSSSQYLFNTICKAGGDSVSNSYNAELKRNSTASVIAVKADGQLASKRVYFLPWTANSDTSILRQSIKQFISDAINKAAEEKCQSIAFPAIGCGQYGCSISLVAQVMVAEAQRTLRMHNISVMFVIQPERTDIYVEFQKQINLIQPKSLSSTLRKVSIAVGKGVIEVEKGNITMQQVDVIIGSSSSENLRKAIIKAAGNEVQAAYNAQFKSHPNSVLIATPPGSLFCKQILFVKWEPDTDEEVLRQSLVDLMWTVVQHVKSHQFSSIAFPAIGCGQHGCAVDIVVKTMVNEMKTQLSKRNLHWTVKFVVQPDQENVYEEFCKQVLSTNDGIHGPNHYQLPSTWDEATDDIIRFVLSTKSDEYKSIVTNFDQAMTGNYTEIIKIERIQNERWYMQYLAHSKDFKKRLKTDTEKRLYHGCPQQASNSIINEGFNRSFAGVNGTVYGKGVYFSSNATYSHGFGVPNTNGERCMFIARVLVGKSTVGDTSMKTRPVGFDSTTGLDHIFVTYHDAQAFAEYLITYK